MGLWGIFVLDLHRAYVRLEGGKFSRIFTLLRAPGVHAVFTYRLGHWLLGKNFVIKAFLLPIYVVLNYRMKAKWGIQIFRRTAIGEGLYVGHWGGIFISAYSVIGKNCDIYHDVTIGVSGSGSRYGFPTIGDNVEIAPGSKIHGKITIGNNVRIGPNTVVDRDIPDDAFVHLVPSRVIRFPNRYSSIGADHGIGIDVEKNIA